MSLQSYHCGIAPIADNHGNPQLYSLELSYAEVNIDHLYTILRNHKLKNIQLDHHLPETTSAVWCALRDGQTLLYVDMTVNRLRYTDGYQYDSNVSYMIDKATVGFQAELEATIDGEDRNTESLNVAVVAMVSRNG